MAIVVAALVLVPLLPSVKAPPLAPYEAWGIARNEAGTALALGTPIRTFIDGVDYSNFTATYRADGSYQTQIVGNYYIGPTSETAAIKEGGDPTDPVMFADGDLTTGGKVFRQDATWQTATFQNLDLQEAVSAKQPALLKICRVTTQPGDGLSQYAYLYNPTASAVDLSNYFFQKDTPGGYAGPTVALTGSVPPSAEIFADFLSDTYLTRTGDALKLVYTNPGGADSPFGGRNVIVDRVEFNATTGGTLYWEPGNTIVTDAPAPGNNGPVNGEIHRAPNCGTDTNQGTDFVLGPETGRPTAPTVGVTMPNGGQRWTGGSPHRIWWNMTDAQSSNTALTVTITYSTDSGGTYPNTVVSGRAGAANPNWYLWTVPTIDTDRARVKVCATDPTALTGCDESDADFSIDSTPPTVIITTPAAGATNVALSTDIIVQFSEPMNKASVESQFTLAPDLNPKTYQWNLANDTLTVVLPNLSPGTNYQACIGTLAKDASDPGKYLAGAPKCWSFSTFTNNPPTISISQPSGGQRWSGGFPHTISWTMSDDRTAPGQLVAYLNYTSTTAGNGNIAGPLTGQTTYDWMTACINAADVKVQLTVIDGDGAQSSVESFQFEIDCTPPTVTSTTPADSATGVSITAAIQVQFSEAMDQASVQTAFSISPNPGGLAFNWAGTTLTVTHNSFAAGTHYSVTISTAAKDTSNPGLTMALAKTFAFDTIANQAPTVTVNAPAAGSSYSPGAVITITWTMSDAETATANLVVYVNYTSSAGSGSISGRLTGATTFSWTAPSISANDVRVQVTVIDEGGLSDTGESGAFTISGGGIDVMMLAIIGIIIAVIVVALLVFLMLKRRKKKEGEEAPAEPEEAPPERAPPPPPRAAAPAPRAPAAAPPPPPAAAAGTKECPGCGTIIDGKDAECFMCGHKFE